MCCANATPGPVVLSTGPGCAGKRRIESETNPARFDVDQGELRRVVERFIRASTDGDMDALLQVLDPEVVGWTDTGGAPGAPREAVVGRDRVMKLLLAFLRNWNVTLAPMPMNGEPGAAAYSGSEPIAVLALRFPTG